MIQTDHSTFYRTVQVDGLDIFYRKAGEKQLPTILMQRFLTSHLQLV